MDGASGPACDVPLLVGTFGPRSAAEMLRVLGAPETSGAGVVELRLDLVPDVASHLQTLIAASPRPVLATCRRAADGGAWQGGEAERLALLRRAVAAGAAWVDVEADVGAGEWPDGVTVVRSLHVERVPDDPVAVAERLLAAGDVAKLVAWRGDETDVLRLLGAVRALAGRLAGHVVSHPFSRLASLAMGAPFTYASLRPGGRLDVRMPTVAGLRDDASAAAVSSGTPLFVLVGGDVEASVSPQMLNAAFRSAGAPIVAARWSCADPLPLLAALPLLGWAGLAVTIPHKSVVHGHLVALGAPLDAAARAAQAANTVLVRDGVVHGCNTDGLGLLDALAPHLAAAVMAERDVLVVGAGGAARAAVVACSTAGARVTVFARRAEAAQALRPLGAAEVAESADVAVAAGPDVVIDATPAGPPGGTAVLDAGALPRRAVVLDMLVSQRDTALLAAARAAGHTVVPGFDMLVHQAVHQVRLLTGRDVAAEVLAAEGRRRLSRRARRIVLVGLRCTGKTEVGRRLAELLSRPFLDIDREVAAALGRTPDDLIASGEESAFRQAEAAALLAACDVPGAVVATGGGAALAQDALRRAAADAVVVLLEAADDELLRRWTLAPRAPLTGLPPAAELARQHAERSSTYRELATHRVDTTDLPAVEVAEALASRFAFAVPPAG